MKHHLTIFKVSGGRVSLEATWPVTRPPDFPVSRWPGHRRPGGHGGRCPGFPAAAADCRALGCAAARLTCISASLAYTSARLAWGKGRETWGKNREAWGECREAWGKGHVAWGNEFETWGNAFEAWGNANRLCRRCWNGSSATIQVWFVSTEASGRGSWARMSCPRSRIPWTRPGLR